MKNRKIIYFVLIIGLFLFVNTILIYILTSSIIDNNVTREYDLINKNTNIQSLGNNSKQNHFIYSEKKNDLNNSNNSSSKTEHETSNIILEVKPTNGSIVKDNPLKITGKTLPNKKIFIGAYESKSNELGEFTISINLLDGKNIFQVILIDDSKILKETTLTYMYSANN